MIVIKVLICGTRHDPGLAKLYKAFYVQSAMEWTLWK